MVFEKTLQGGVLMVPKVRLNRVVKEKTKRILRRVSLLSKIIFKQDENTATKNKQMLYRSYPSTRKIKCLFCFYLRKWSSVHRFILCQNFMMSPLVS